MSAISVIQSALTMSSRELSKITDKPHDNVLKVIRSLVDGGVVKNTIPSQWVNPQNKQQYPEFLCDKRDSLVIVARLSPEFTAAIVDRWQELENNSNPMSIAATMNSDQLGLLLSETKAKELAQQQLAIAAPAVAFVERYVESSGLMGFRQVCKLLGAKENDFRSFLIDQKIMYKLGGEWVPYEPHIRSGRFVVKTGTAENEHSFNSAKFTPKGVEWISAFWNNCLH